MWHGTAVGGWLLSERSASSALFKGPCSTLPNDALTSVSVLKEGGREGPGVGGSLGLVVAVRTESGDINTITTFSISGDGGDSCA